MTSQKSARKDDVERRLQAVLDDATALLGHLKERTALPQSVAGAIERHVAQSLPLPPGPAIAAKSQILDVLGTNLWNATANLLKGEELNRDPRINAVDNITLAVRTRLFALLLLESVYRTSSRRSEDRDQRIRVFKIALSTARSCLAHSQLEYALKALQHCSEHAAAIPVSTPPIIQLSHPKQSESDDDSRDIILLRLAAEYLLLRILHAWKSDRLDLAQHFCSQFSLSDVAITQNLAEKAADVFCELAKGLSHSQKQHDARAWYERALVALDSCNSDAFCQETAELRLSVSVAFVRDLLSDGDAETCSRAWDIVHQLDQLHALSGRLIIPVLQCRILTSRSPADNEHIREVLLRMVKLAVLTEDNLKMMLQTLHNAAQVSSSSALTVTEELISVRLLTDLGISQQSDNHVHAWIEKAAVTYILIAVRQLSGTATVTSARVKRLLDAIAKGIQQFSAHTTHAAQALIWKAAVTLDKTAAIEWFGILRHAVFENAGLLNKARIGRKIIHTALLSDDASAAREAFYSMSESAQNEDATRYLAFKVALMSRDNDMALESLRIIVRGAHKDPTYLYGSVLEAQNADMGRVAVVALQALLDQRPRGVHIPALLRCTARLLVTEAKSRVADKSMVISEMLRIFETAAASMDQIRHDAPEVWRAEVPWWSKNIYNQAIELAAEIDPRILVRILTVCIRFLDQHLTDASSMHLDQVQRRRLACLFLCTSAFIALARSSEDGSAEFSQYYLQAQQCIERFTLTHGERLASSQIQERTSTNQRLLEMLKFDLECVLRLRQWDKLSHALQACLKVPELDNWDTLADLLIIMHHEMDDNAKDSQILSLMTNLLQKCINESWKKDRDMVKVARWLRFTFTTCLADQQSDFSFKLLGQAATMAQTAYGKDRKEPYPEAELHWLASTSFNHAVDLLQINELGTATKWIEGALELARWAEDNGSLHATLTAAREQARSMAKRSDL